MMDIRKRGHSFVLIIVIGLLFLPVSNSFAGLRSERTEQQLPDVTITNLTFSESEPKEGDNITVSITVRNNESRDISNLNISLVDMYFERNLTEWEAESIEGKNESTFNYEWEPEGGRHNITAMVTFNGLELDRRSEEIWVEPEPIGDVYSPILALIIIFVVIFGSVVIPSVIAFMTNKNSSRERD